LKIAFLATNALVNTGGNLYDLVVMKGLADAGHDVHLHTSGFEEVSLRETGVLIVPEGVKLHFHRKPFQFYPSNWLLLSAARMIRGGKTIWDMATTIREHYDLLVYCEDLAASVYPVASKKADLNLAIIHHIGEPDSLAAYMRGVARGVNPYAYWMQRLGDGFLRRMDLVVAVSEYWKRRLIGEYGCRRVAVIPNGIDPNYFSDAGDPEGFRRRYGLEDKLVVLMGIYGRGRGLETMLRAVCRVPNAVLLVTGRRWSDPIWMRETGPLFARAEKMGRFLWTGVLPPREYKAALLAADAVAVLSEYEEGWSRMLHEGALAGKPLITTGLGGMGEIAKQTWSLVVKPRDVEEVERALWRVASLSARDREVIGDVNRSWASGFTWNHTIERWVKLVKSLEVKA
jgi:glycosyltransferase involved in cell wall biosynthesis